MGAETVDHPTDGELVASSRNYFKSDHQTQPRIHAVRVAVCASQWT